MCFVNTGSVYSEVWLPKRVAALYLGSSKVKVLQTHSLLISNPDSGMYMFLMVLFFSNFSSIIFIYLIPTLEYCSVVCHIQREFPNIVTSGIYILLMIWE